MNTLIALALAALAFVAMEVVAWATHRWIMHGRLWTWHESHHRPRTGVFERNDRFVVVFSLIAILLFAVGTQVPYVTAIALGITAYGVAYFTMHEVLVHRRLPFPFKPKSGYLARLVAAHHLHHAVHTKEGAVSFGFLYAPPLETLRAQLRQGVNRRPETHD
ncbi:MAG: sterol desaturase family protein [Thermomicrobiales bacterium]